MSYSVKAYLKLDKKDKESGRCPIGILVTLNSRTTKFTLSNHFAWESIWDKRNGLINISLVQKDKEHLKDKVYFEEINDAIKLKQSQFKLFMLEQERMQIDMSVEKIRTFFRGGSSLSFFKFWDEQFELMKPKFKSSTILSYQDTKKILMKFRSRLDFGDIDLQLIKKFDNYLIEERKNSAGGRFNRHKNLKCILKQAILNKQIKENPYDHFKIEPAKGKRNFLSLEEVKTLSLLQLPKEHQDLKEVFNMFIFSCYTGLRYSDLQNLRWKNVSIAESKIEVKMVKTSADLNLPLVPQAVDIIKSLSRFNHPESFVFKRITNQALNRSLKVVMKEAKIEKDITFHCARHTFATILIEIGESIYNVKGLLGHQDVQNTQIYAKLLQKELNTSMTNLAQRIVAF